MNEEYNNNLARLRYLTSNSVKIPLQNDFSTWQPARPLPGFFFQRWKHRLRGALLVLIGKAEYVRWY